jgi:hypothetical protein
MSSSMAFYIAGALAIFTGIVHGFVGERRIVGAIQFPNTPVRILSRWILWVSAAAWVAAGILYIAVAATGDRTLAPTIVITQAVVLAIGAYGNFRATRGRHPGWALLAASIGFSFYGLAGLC